MLNNCRKLLSRHACGVIDTRVLFVYAAFVPSFSASVAIVTSVIHGMQVFGTLLLADIAGFKVCVCLRAPHSNMEMLLYKLLYA